MLRINNNIQKLFPSKHIIATDMKSGIYKLSCTDCDHFYVGQTGRTFKEHLLYKNIRNMKSNFAQDLINEKHMCIDFDINLRPLYISKKKD